MTTPNSAIVMVPSSSLSNSMKASLNSVANKTVFNLHAKCFIVSCIVKLTRILFPLALLFSCGNDRGLNGTVAAGLVSLLTSRFRVLLWPQLFISNFHVLLYQFASVFNLFVLRARHWPMEILKKVVPFYE